jgi:PAS domain S-box-containing protein
MNEGMNSLHTRLRVFAFAAGGAAMFSATLLFARAAGFPGLTNLSPRIFTMKPVTALCFFLSGISLSLLVSASPLTPMRRRIAQAPALFVLLACVATCVEFATGWNVRFEDFLFPQSLFAAGHPAHLSLAAAVAFALLSVALVLLDLETPQGVRTAQYLSLGVVLLSLIHLLIDLYTANDFSHAVRQDSLAVQSALLFFLLALGVIAARPDRGLAAVFCTPGIAGRMPRRVLPAAVLSTILTGWLQLLGERHGLYGTAVGLALFATANIAMFFVLIGLAARSLISSAEKQDSASRDLALTNERANFLLGAIIQSSDDAIISKALDGTITSWNAGAERIFQYSAAEAVGQSTDILLPPDRVLEEVDILRRIASGESVNHFESIRIRKDGKPILVSVTISPLRDSAGAIIGASKIARDITQSRHTERANAEQEARLTAIIGSAMDAIITVDERQCITMFNPAAEAMFGYRSADVLGSTLDHLIPAPFRPEQADLSDLSHTDVTIGRVRSISGLRSNGQEFPIEASISQTQIHDEKLFTVILRDVTDRKRSEEELRQQSALLDLAPVIVRDMAGRITLWTRGAQQLYRYSKEHAIGRICHELLQTQFPIPVEQIDQVLHRDGAWEGQLRHRTRDGRIVFVASQWVLHYDAQGTPARLLEISADLTELKLAQTLQLRSQKLQSLGTLAGGVAHDFNNILLSINGNTKMALEDLPPDHPVRQNLSEIAKAGARAADLVSRILSFSRPHEQNREEFFVQPIVEEALNLVRATLPASIHMETSFAPELPPVALDSTQLHQVIVNLATNASHAIGSKTGIITVRLSARTITEDDCIAIPDLHEGRYVCLSVSDDGCGMDRATLDRVFDPFFTTKPVGKGTGLGLSIVHGIVSSHGGAVTAYSQPGHGTSFTLYFPAVERPANAPAPVVVIAPERGHQEHILYVDDEEGLVMLGTLFLQRLGYQVTGHVDASAALEDFRSRPDFFAAVVTDLSMPRMSGFELVRQLLAVRPDLPILLTSGYVRPEEEVLASQLGIRRIILKPSTVDDLAEALFEALHAAPVPAPIPVA